MLNIFRRHGLAAVLPLVNITIRIYFPQQLNGTYKYPPIRRVQQ
jgi:hypothetical protein